MLLHEEILGKHSTFSIVVCVLYSHKPHLHLQVTHIVGLDVTPLLQKYIAPLNPGLHKPEFEFVVIHPISFSKFNIITKMLNKFCVQNWHISCPMI